jgi:hypothetical protein
MENTPELNAALVAAIAETTDVHADATNPFHKSKYATLGAHLAAIKPVFAKHGLAIVQFPIGFDKSVGVRTVIVHKSGQSIGADFLLNAPEVTNKEGVTKHGFTAQEAGAVLSYSRRYALASVAGTATEDDDAEVTRVAGAPSQAVVKSNYIPNPNAVPAAKVAAMPVEGDIDPSLTVPFGRSKGQAIGSLGADDLKYWATVWEPRPYEKTGKVTKKDATLKATAVALFNGSAAPKPVEPVANLLPDDGEDVPF